jgi:hypothetical protein
MCCTFGRAGVHAESTKTFRNWDKDFVARLPKDVRAQFPAQLSHELGMNLDLLHDFLTGVRNGVSMASLCSQYNEAVRVNYLEAERFYLLWLYFKQRTLKAGEVKEVKYT